MHRNEEAHSIRAEDILCALEHIGISIFLYYPQQRRIVIPDKLRAPFHCESELTNMPYSFAENYVLPEDKQGFIEMYEKIHRGEATASARFRGTDRQTCVRDTLTTVTRDEHGAPLLVFGIVTDASDSYRNDQLSMQLQQHLRAERRNAENTEVMQTVAASISGQYYAIYYIWVESRTYICFNEGREGVLSAIGEKGDYEPALEFYIKNYVLPEDQADVLAFTNLSAVKEQLRDRQSISHTYRQKDIGWTRGKFIASKRDADGNVTNVVYSVANINSEVEPAEEQKQAIYEANHDALTGLYNRKGFEGILAAEKVKSGHVGFAILDIDNFKPINDHFGHAMGDQVLVAVAEQLTSAFYPTDVIARIGGDEFAVLFRDCDASAWDKICQKLCTVHATLATRFPKELELSVTLSGGISFSDTGYWPSMYQLADEGLYETKKLGRAGCTLIGAEHEILKHWQDETLSIFAKNVMEYNNAGVCQVEIPDDPQEPRRFLCGDAAKQILGLPKLADPETCYTLFEERIDPAYRDTLFEAEQTILGKGQTECTFLWHHPNHGRIHLRCGGYAEKKDEKTILSGYCHVLKETNIVERKDDQGRILRALNNIFIASYYLDLKANTSTAYKLGPGADYIPPDTNCISDRMDSYISTIIDPRDREIMREFLDMQTLPERLQKNRFLDAEYRSFATQSWCRARLIPVRYDADGRLSHALLTVTALDSKRLREKYTLDYNRRSLAALFDHLPCGVVMYEWDGHTVKTVHTSAYYEREYGYATHPGKGRISARDYSRVHPDDREGYRAAIKEALTNAQTLHYEYRVWNRKKECYCWSRVDAECILEPDGTTLVYALYQDITTQKEQEVRLEKSHTSLQAALNASNQLCYEYDPLLRTEESLTEENFLGMPPCIENYPESLRENDLIHPEDVETFIETVHRMDDGTERAHCDVRMKKNGSYIWYSCTFNRYYDAQKERYVAILTVVDISARMATQKMYEDRLQALSSVTENTLCMSVVDLTNKTYRLLDCQDSVRPFVNTALPLEEYLVYASCGIVGEEDQRKFRQLFRLENLLQQAAEGNMHHEIEYLFRTSDAHYMWILSAIDLVRNPLTGEVIGTVYSKSQQTEKMNQMLLNKTLEQDYLFIAAIFVESDAFYLYNYHDGNTVEYMEHFWGIALSNMSGNCAEDVQRELTEMFVKENVLRHLEHQSEYSYAYNGMISHKMHRLEIRFSYADASRTLLLASMRNITDTSLLEKYRHDSEHDTLTDLYNRNTLFRRCRELLDAHPEEQFTMLHIDIKHFRLYNTFFGDAAGDQLLCDLADLIRQGAAGYEYAAYGRIEADVFAMLLPYNREIYRRHILKLMCILREYRQDFLIEPTIGMYHVTDRTMPIEAMFTRATVAAKMVQPDTPYATVVFDREMEKTLRDNQEILNEMQTAIDEEQFHIYLQPKYSLRTGNPVGAEALVRWIHPEKGLIHPSRFISLFESNGFIATLDQYIWEHTCQFLSECQKNGQPILPISVNVSRISAYSQDTVPFLKALVQKYDIDPKYLELELTESAYVESPKEIHSRMEELQEYGFKILMDDFGSGYSSLNTLKDLAIDILKLDMKFLSSGENERGSKILFSMIRMSKLLHIPVIAEGVENMAQAEYLRSIGCEYVQGYLYARPMPTGDYLNMLCAEQKREPEDIPDAQVSNTIMENTVLAQLIDDKVANPLALIGYQNSRFAILRANLAFIRAFGLQEDMRPASELIQEHLSEEDNDRVLRGFARCAETKKSVSYHISWRNRDNTTHRYLVNVVYTGYIGTEQVFTVAYIDEEPEDYIR